MPTASFLERRRCLMSSHRCEILAPTMRSFGLLRGDNILQGKWRGRRQMTPVVNAERCLFEQR